jgi:hypothetical protein
VKSASVDSLVPFPSLAQRVKKRVRRGKKRMLKSKKQKHLAGALRGGLVCLWGVSYDGIVLLKFRDKLRTRVSMGKGFVLHPAMPASLPPSMPDEDRASTKRGREEKGLLPSLPANHVELTPLVMHRMFSGR